nr:hypothetical protein [Rubrobacter tropicus]
MVAHVGDLELTHDQAQVLDGADAPVDAVADEARDLVVPLGEEEVDGVLERPRDGVVVLRGHEDESVERRDLCCPLVGVWPSILAGEGGDGLVEMG